jgi:hypothetical protein
MKTQSAPARIAAIHAAARPVAADIIGGKLLRGPLFQFIGTSQAAATREALRGEEGEAFAAILARLADTITTMPTSYQTDGRGRAAIAHLHYFRGGMDWYITERDIDADGEGQVQAFGLANLGYGAELGYISLPEILAAGVELDYHWSPRALSAIAD